jgi:hypothetical protein
MSSARRACGAQEPSCLLSGEPALTWRRFRGQHHASLAVAVPQLPVMADGGAEVFEFPTSSLLAAQLGVLSAGGGSYRSQTTIAPELEQEADALA